MRDGKCSAPSIVLEGTRIRDGFSLEFERLAVQGRWTQVMRKGENVAVIGWLQSSDVVPLRESTLELGCCSTYGGLLSSEAGGDPTTVTYEGPAEVALGTPVFSASGELWAIVGQGGTFGVRRQAEDWARLTHIPGVSGAFAYVATSAVLFPAGVRPHRRAQKPQPASLRSK